MRATYDENLWRSLYRLSQGTIDGVVQPVLTYGWNLRNRTPMFSTRKDWLTGYGLDNNASVLVVGCAFGYLIEKLFEAGISDVWGIDDSPWIWDPANINDWPSGDKPDGVRSHVANDYIGSGTEQASLNALGVTGQAKFKYVLDEDAASSHADVDLPAFIAGCEARLQGNARGNIIHIVTPLPESGPGDSAINWKTMAEWKQVAPSHRWVDAVTGAEQT